MNKGKAVLAIAIIISGAGLYILSTKKRKATFTPAVSLDKIQEEEDAASTNVKVDTLMPQFGVPRNILPSSTKSSSFKNYIDVQTNNYFNPKSGVFYQ